MKNSDFEQEMRLWLDRFIETHGEPRSFLEYIVFVMDTATDEGKI